MKQLLAVAVAAISLVSASTADARTFRVGQVPNGEAFDCALCHVNASGAGPRTAFGDQVFETLPAANRASADVVWSEVYDRDGDGDGYSNGLELGDPDGTWMIGDPDPAAFTSPIDPMDNLCGDGILNGPEECDGDAAGAACSDMGLGPGGEVTCNERCRLDFTMCEGFVAPNAETNNTANNSTANAATNNSTTGGNEGTTDDPGGDAMIDDGFVDDGAPESDSACSTAGSTPGVVGLLLGFFFLRRRRD